ncbi:PDR/VanB family oxidoreductase [Noviherbaspirillum saxi]|uniref:Oxidoreductase n=1 Tax=Noviherbaspirillum saxi TaxID=2320863 RepID=A0A3A3FJU6_9BURK|nr:PDR/VanB family oxidoreductase [Noviherbaspirillum saxi]RJF95773.1 oxidoreductase [Noviherbaspirillum saxi]
MKLIVQSVTPRAEGIVELELRSPEGTPLPAFTAGAHIDLHLDNGITRCYSLVNSPHDVERYVVAVNKDPASKGGSRYVHEVLRPGMLLQVGEPRNNFPLVEDAPMVVFFAGGIGVTPLWCMIQRLESLGRPWMLVYGARSRKHCAYMDEIGALGERLPGRIRFHFNDEHGGQPMDLNALILEVPADAHLYCCGPTPMLEAFEQATASRPAGTAHVEYFAAKHAAAVGGGYKVTLARRNRTLEVAQGKSILDVLLESGVDVPHACKEGICGACQTTVLKGTPDHRDSYLSPGEMKSGKTIMICCSGSKCEELVLDL